jgi:alpha-galactosidase
MSRRIETLAFLLSLAMTCQGFAAGGKGVPAELPRPDGKPADATKPVKVYILAGQSNMVGFGTLSGSKCAYDGIYLLADPDIPFGPLPIFADRNKAANFKFMPLGVYVSADANAAKGGLISVHKGTYDAARDYDKSQPVKTMPVALGFSAGVLPVAEGETGVVRAFIEVPDSGEYTCTPGYGDSALNIMELDGMEVYKKTAGQPAVWQKVRLEKGKRYPIKITYFKGGSTAMWLSRQDLKGYGDLESLTRRDKKFPWLIDDQGKWTVRNDVYFRDVRLTETGKGCLMSAASNSQCLPKCSFIGPEVGFGFVMGEFHDEQVLLIKSSIGNRSLNWDFRPPSSGPSVPGSTNQFEGLEYRLMVEGVRKTVAQLDQIIPGYKGQGYEIAGLVWFQGHKDAGQTQAQYEGHLVNLIRDLQKDFKVPGMKAVVATVGFDGYNINPAYQEVWKAQMAVGDPTLHPELAGQVKSVDTRGFWRDEDESPTGVGYHYNKNAETYMLTGDALGRAMVELMGGKAEPLPYGNRPPPAGKVDVARKSDDPVARKALEPIAKGLLIPEYIANNSSNLLCELRSDKMDTIKGYRQPLMEGLVGIYNSVGIKDYDWREFGPAWNAIQWDYFSFDPPEQLAWEPGGVRYRPVTVPKGLEKWYDVDFDARKAGWKKGLQPFGQEDGKLRVEQKPWIDQHALKPLENRKACRYSFCHCCDPMKTLWENEVLLMRTTLKLPAFKDGHRYRLVVGGQSHAGNGEGFRIYVNGKQMMEKKAAEGTREGDMPICTYIDKAWWPDFQGGEVTVAVISFVKIHKRSRIKGNFIGAWFEEMKVPPLDSAGLTKPAASRAVPREDEGEAGE